MTYDIIDIVKKLIGEIKPYGSTEIDTENLKHMDTHNQVVLGLVKELGDVTKYEKNLEDYNDLLTVLVEDLMDVSEYKDDYRYSVQELGTKATKILREISQYINDVIEEPSADADVKNPLEITASLPFNIGDTIADSMDFKYRVLNIHIQYDIGAHFFKYTLDLTRTDLYCLFSTDDINEYHLVDSAVVY